MRKLFDQIGGDGRQAAGLVREILHKPDQFAIRLGREQRATLGDKIGDQAALKFWAAGIAALVKYRIVFGGAGGTHVVSFLFKNSNTRRASSGCAVSAIAMPVPCARRCTWLRRCCRRAAISVCSAFCAVISAPSSTACAAASI